MQRKADEKRSPIKDAPLRDPGQSLREEIWDFVYDKILAWTMFGTFAIIFTAIEWLRWWRNIQPSPIFFSVFTILFLGFCSWRLRRAYQALAHLKLGFQGERATGQYLQNELLRQGYYVFHDICDDDFNIDHAIIGPGGAFSIETKTRSKRADSKVTYDGTKVLVDGFEPDRDPVVQARAGAARLKDILLKYSGHETYVRPVVVFPGWFVEPQPKGAEVWVLNEKAFIKFVANETQKLSVEQQRALAEGLARYIRERDAK